jgi:hypothetical protein
MPFLKQRIRWAGDSKKFWKFNIPFYITSIATLILNVGIIATPIIYGFNVFLSPWFMNILLLKFIVELILIYKGNDSFSRKFSIIDFLQWFILQPLYVLIVSICSILNINPTWQGRKP